MRNFEFNRFKIREVHCNLKEQKDFSVCQVSGKEIAKMWKNTKGLKQQFISCKRIFLKAHYVNSLNQKLFKILLENSHLGEYNQPRRHWRITLCWREIARSPNKCGTQITRHWLHIKDNLFFVTDDLVLKTVWLFNNEWYCKWSYLASIRGSLLSYCKVSWAPEGEKGEPFMGMRTRAGQRVCVWAKRNPMVAVEKIHFDT